MPDMPKPQKEHEWLQRLTGEWEAEARCFMDPNGPPSVNTGIERVRALGGFWIISEVESDSAENPYANLSTTGFDPTKGKYISTWIDTMTSYLWKSEGTLNEAGTILTMEAEGICPLNPGRLTRTRDVTELKGADLKVMTSSMLGEDGNWNVGMVVTARRKS